MPQINNSSDGGAQRRTENRPRAQRSPYDQPRQARSNQAGASQGQDADPRQGNAYAPYSQQAKPALKIFTEPPKQPKKMKVNIVFVVIAAVTAVAAFVGGSIFALDRMNLIDLPEAEETTRADYDITAAVYETDSSGSPAVYEEPRQPVELGNETACEHALLVNVSTGEILARKSEDEIAYPASITKIMTAIVAIENIGDLDTEVKLDYEMFEYIYSKNASTAGFYYGERVKAIDLLYGLILPSGADAALGLAKLTAGSEEEFVKLMNEKCAELKMENTHFTNCTGLHDINHYSTCSDLYRLLRYALRNQTFFDVFTTFEYTTSPTNIHSNGVKVQSTIKHNYDKEGLPLGYVIGGKTGFTDPAKQCMATLALKDGEYYALIVLGCGDGTTKRASHALCSADVWNRFLGEYPAETADEAAG
ncbi:MAG: D-alanyl-D-alanine carboxypeptidase [Clostridiales bacterium]|nr:D-alanyl-D-alanine carboxypeptidase [Clostridiales bacterium]